MTEPLLALDLSQRASHLALACGGREHARRFESEPHAERERFWDELRELFAEAGASAEALGAVAVAVGPGGFTGLRVAIAFAKSVALARSLPVVGLPSARVFAASDAARGGKGPWLVALASKSGTAFVAEVSSDSRDACSLVAPGAVMAAEAFAQRCRAVAANGGVLLSDEHLDATLAQVAADAGLATRPLETDPAALLALAARELAAGRTDDPQALSPEYAREPEAVTKWRERAKI